MYKNTVIQEQQQQKKKDSVATVVKLQAAMAPFTGQ